MNLVHRVSPGLGLPICTGGLSNSQEVCLHYQGQGEREGLGGSQGGGGNQQQMEPALSLAEPETSVTSLTEAPHLQATLSHHITTPQNSQFFSRG